MDEDRSWMYQRIKNGSLNKEFVLGVTGFLNHAFNTDNTTLENGRRCIKCPCRRCDNIKRFERNVVSQHLLDYGFCPMYERWYEHGEPRPTESETATNVDGIAEMLIDAAGPEFDWDARDDAEQPPNDQGREFFNMLDASQKPLWEIPFEGEQTKICENLDVLSAITACLALKSENHMSEKCFNGMLSIMKTMLPQNNELPKNFYETKRLVGPLGLGYEKIDVCPNNCMLYYTTEEKLKDKCDTCGESRYEISKSGRRIPRKILRYLPITPRLQRMYMTRATAKHMRWHKEGHRDKPGLMVHPADGQAWKIFDGKYTDFANEVGNVRLGLSADGFAPYNSTAAPYTCWPVFIFPYNLPPDLIMRDENMFLTLLIPGPQYPGRDIDVFLRPLIEELKTLWRDGAETYDISRNRNFTMKAALMWTVSDFPAYELLSGWGTKGKLACPYCMEQTKAFTLEEGRKACWFDCHRVFLPDDHPFRRQRNKFKRNTQEFGERPTRLSGAEIEAIVNRLPKIKWGKTAPLNQIPDYLKTHHWQKRSIFWDLPYWSTNEIRHNLDIMHIEKNFGDNIINMILDIAGKTKDNMNARKDLEKICNRPHLHLTEGGKKKPRASYALKLEDKRQVLRWLKEKIKFPDGYASNWSRCVNLSKCTISGLKSHDVHVFLQRLMPVAFRDFVPHEVWEALNEVSIFFRELCAKELDPKIIDKLESNIIVTLCKLEKVFPPSFFDSMEHIVVHLAHEARMGGPVHFRWMYSSERCNKIARRTVTNKARVEGSIVEAYIIKEISNYSTHYLHDDLIKSRQHNTRHDVGPEIALDGRPAIFNYPGRAIVKGVQRKLSDSEYDAAHFYVLNNCPEIEPLMGEFKEYIRSTRSNINDSLLTSVCQQEFPDWVKPHVMKDRDCDPHIKRMCLGPDKQVNSYGAYDINGFRFHTRKHGINKKTDNSGVCIEGETCDFYGILEDIVELDYSGCNKVVLFKCTWFDAWRGVKVDTEHGIVEVKHKSRLRNVDEPFGLACQAIQVYYLPYASKERRDWWVVMKTRRKPIWGFENDATNNSNNSDIFQEESHGCSYTVTQEKN